MATKFSSKNPWSLTKVSNIAGVKDCARVREDQPEVKLHRNALWLPNFVGRTLDQRVMHCWIKGVLWLPHLVERTPDQNKMHCMLLRLKVMSCRGQPGSTRGQIARNSPMATKFGNSSRPEFNTLLGQRSCRGNEGSIRGQLLRNALRQPNVADVTLEHMQLQVL